MTKLWLALTHAPDGDADPGYVHGVFTKRADALTSVDYDEHVENGARIEGLEESNSNVVIGYGGDIIAQVIRINTNEEVEIDV